MAQKVSQCGARFVPSRRRADDLIVEPHVVVEGAARRREEGSQPMISFTALASGWRDLAYDVYRMCELAHFCGFADAEPWSAARRRVWTTRTIAVCRGAVVDGAQ
jgi:hypothetical protein